MVAGLALKPTKCFIIPLATPISAIVIQQIKDFLNAQIPAWQQFNITATAEYLGIWMGPSANTRQWTSQISKYIDRTNLIAESAPPTAIALGTYNMKAITVLSYPAQFLPTPPNGQTFRKICLHQVVQGAL
eukprot:10196365-Karenia_brevis.AAC.1